MPGTLELLAFDHRASFVRGVLGVEGPPDERAIATARSAKALIAAGLVDAVERGVVERAAAGALVDVTYGEDAIEALREIGVRVAVPVEESGAPELAFEDGWRARLTSVAPDWAKVLVKDNPRGDPERSGRQRGLVRELHEVCGGEGRALMLELLVPPEPWQEGETYDTEVRPALVVEAIEAIRADGVTPAVWKLEGFERPEHCRAVADVAGAPCVVLGRGEDEDAVERWLRASAGVDGFVGFAIGRSIWWDAIQTWLQAGAGDDAREVAIRAIAKAYERFVEVFRHASVDR